MICDVCWNIGADTFEIDDPEIQKLIADYTWESKGYLLQIGDPFSVCAACYTAAMDHANRPRDPAVRPRLERAGALFIDDQDFDYAPRRIRVGACAPYKPKR